MKAIRLKVRAVKDGELVLHNLPIHKSDKLEVILLKEEQEDSKGAVITDDPVLKL